MNSTMHMSRVLSTCSQLQFLARCPQINKGDELELTARLGEGTYGEVYISEHLNGNPLALPVVVKIFKVGIGIDPAENAATLVRLHAQIATTALPAGWEQQLIGVPFWVGEAKFGHSTRYVAVSTYLGAAGFEPFHDIVEETPRFRRYRATDLAQRVRLARAFAEQYSVLEQLNFVHGDLNPENIFVNQDDVRVAIIDFDTGAVIINGDEVPLTAGKADDFVAPELKDRFGVQLDHFDRGAELWAVGVMAHYLLFGLGPLFFLSELSADALRRYTTSHTWPEIDTHSSLFFQRNRRAYNEWLPEAQKLPLEAIGAFADFVYASATNPALRPTGAAWAAAFAALDSPPEFDSVSVDQTTIAAGDEVTVTWSARNTNRVELIGHGMYPPVGSAHLTLNRTARIRLAAHNPFDRVETVTNLVRVVPVPVIEWIHLPLPTVIRLGAQITVPAPPPIHIQHLDQLASAILQISHPQFPPPPSSPDARTAATSHLKSAQARSRQRSCMPSAGLRSGTAKLNRSLAEAVQKLSLFNQSNE